MKINANIYVCEIIIKTYSLEKKIFAGEFATQTCFQGRFGEELGSDQFGGQIMIHQAKKDTQVDSLILKI